jgi:hypothetical protein
MVEKKVEGEEVIGEQVSTIDVNVKTGNRLIAALIKWNIKKIDSNIAMFEIWEVVMQDDEMLGFLLRDRWDKINKEANG